MTTPTRAELQAAARVFARAGASKGGLARAKRLTKAQLSAIGKKGGKASGEAKRRAKGQNLAS